MHHAKPQFLSRNAFERSLSNISVNSPHDNVCSHKRDNKKKVFLFNHKIYVANDRFQGNYTEMMTRYKQLLMYIKSAVTRNYSEKSINSILDYISTSKQVRCIKVFFVFFFFFVRDPRATVGHHWPLGELWCHWWCHRIYITRRLVEQKPVIIYQGSIIGQGPLQCIWKTF